VAMLSVVLQLPVSANLWLKLIGFVKGRQLPGVVLSDELGELSQWLCHDDSIRCCFFLLLVCYVPNVAKRSI